MVNYKLDFKMHLLKQTINYIAPRILRLSRGVQPKTPQSKLILSVYARLEAAVARQVETGCWNDKHFSNLLESTKHALIFLCEHDRFYKRWLGLVAMFLTEEVLREKRDFTYEKALELYARPLMLTREEFERHRESLFELYLTGHLYGMSLMKAEDIEKIRKARVERKEVDFPSSDPQAFFRLYFPERESQHGEEKRKE